MENEFEFKRGERKYPVFLSHGIHLIVAYDAYVKDTTITNVVNSLLRDYYTKFYGLDKVHKLESELIKALIPDKETLKDILRRIAKREPRRRRPYKFRKDEGPRPASNGHSSDDDTDS